MLNKIDRYYHTLKYLKKSQLKYLVKNRLERGKKAVADGKAPACGYLPLWMPKLDENPEYHKRFCADGISEYKESFCLEEILEGKVTLLHESGMPGGKNWADSSKSHLWNFNLHYLEFLIPLAAAYQVEKEAGYYECFREYCCRWIADNRDGTGDGWHPYTISLRLTNLWICLDGFGEIVRSDLEFFNELSNSMYAQYLHLQKKLERHLLGNHYFENLKAVMLGALYFKEPGIYDAYKFKLQEEIEEQILPDGVHYERSLMYHKIILEDLMRAAKAVRAADRIFYEELLAVIQKMADAMYSLEEGMGHTPLFNDAGDNVARSMVSLLSALREEYQIMPKYKRAFRKAGYYCLRERGMKILMDAGEIAPSYMPGHGHCDALSFELSCEGHPIFVNSGTGQYQGPFRSYFRSTAAHNTVVIDGEEQSQCWGEHRVARRIKDVFGDCKESWVEGSLLTWTGKRLERKLSIVEASSSDEDADGLYGENCPEPSHGAVLLICDKADGYARAYFHLAPEYEYVQLEQKILVRKKCLPDVSEKERSMADVPDASGRLVCEIEAMQGDQIMIHREGTICSYAPEFGQIRQVEVLEISWAGDGKEHNIQMKFR